MSQPPQGPPPSGPDGPPPEGRPTSGDSWPQQSGQQPGTWAPPSGPGWAAPPPGSPQGQFPPPGQFPGQGQFPPQGQFPAQGQFPPQGQVPPPGGYGTPPGGGWGAPPGGYGQQPYPGGPAGPGWGAPGAPAGGTGNRRTATIITVVASVVLLAVVAVVLVMALGGDDDDATASGSSSSSSSGGGFPTEPADPDPGATDPEEFLALLPSDLTACAESEPTGDGDIAAATCGPALTQPGPAEAQFSLYPDQAALDARFTTDVGALGVEEWPVGEEDCSADTGYGEWTYADGTTGGLVGCGLSDDGYAVLVWTDDEFGAEGSVRVPGGTQEEVGALYEWWTLHSNFGS